MTDPNVVAALLLGLLPNAHAPYSGVHVAAAVEDADGQLHFGVNVENAAYPQGLCAEASAISAAVTAGKTSLAAVFVVSSLQGLVWPCGGCRQKIFEFAAEDCQVVAMAQSGAFECQAIDQLLPEGFRLNPSQVHPD